VKLLKEPFVQFVILGGLLFLAYNFSQSAEKVDADRRIVIDAATQDWVFSNFKKQFRRSPTRAEMDALVNAHIEHEVKYREALTMDLDEGDSIVIRRMMQKFDFLFGGAAGNTVPEDSELRDWYGTNVDAYAIPPTIDFQHHWFSPDRRGNSVHDDAVAMLSKLQSGEEGKGDPFPFQQEFTNATGPEVRNVFGPEFRDAVFNAPVDQWSGPYATGLGYHLVMVTKRTETKPLPFDEVREAVLQDWREFESARILEEMVATLKAAYVVEIDDAALTNFEYSSDDGTQTP
jgi:hypothetical protein